MQANIELKTKMLSFYIDQYSSKQFNNANIVMSTTHELKTRGLAKAQVD